MHNFTMKQNVAFFENANALKYDLRGYERDKGYQGIFFFLYFEKCFTDYLTMNVKFLSLKFLMPTVSTQRYDL